MIVRRTETPGARRRLASGLALFCLLAAPPAFSQMTTLSYRETSDSFTWEIDWDGRAPATETQFLPERPDPSLPELWTPSVRLVAGPRGFRCTFRARHNCRVHEMDAPKGRLLHLTLPFKDRLKGPDEWARVETRPVVHLHTGKDHKDEYDLLARTEVDGLGRKVYRLVLQGAHGLATKPKKLKGGKGKKKSATSY
ncbi:MAG: hypothetical protein HY900_07125 [Deltaproteobacteria bacterium]|nr:hypothetical protein [Deltaproteobacteria bacterium]